MDLDALSRDIETVESWNAGWRRNVPWPAIRRIVAATRAVLDSEEAWWCKEHGEAAHITDDSQTEPDYCDDIDWKRCSVVRVRLLAEEGT